MTLLGPLLIVAFYASAIFLGTQETGITRVHILDETSLMMPDDFVETDNFIFNRYDGNNVDSLKSYIIKQTEREGDHVGVYLPGNLTKLDMAKIYYVNPLSSSKQSELRETINDYAERLKVEEQEIDIDQYKKIQTRMNIAVIDAVTDETSLSEVQGFIGFVFALVIYMFIFMYGVMVMRGVIEEKTSRIVEVMVSSVKPFQLMMGKIVGIAMVGLTQFLMWVFLSGILMVFLQSALLPDMYDAANVAGPSDEVMMSQELINELGDQGSTELDPIVQVILNTPWGLLIGLFIFYFLGGYLLYASLFAAVGSAVDSETDTQQFMLPITLPLIFGFMVSLMSAFNPGGSALVWLSHIPFTSPIAMLVRVAMGDYVWWELIISMVTLVLTFILCVKLASKIYRTGILMYGKKITYRELFKWLRYK